MDTIQGYESGAVRLRVMAPDGMGVASNENGGENTFELPFPSPSEIEPQDQCALVPPPAPHLHLYAVA